jgi:hypothetical protein
MKFFLAILSACVVTAFAFRPSGFLGKPAAPGLASSTMLEMKYKVAVVGGGPSGACAAEIFAQEKNIDTVFFERKMDNAKPCGGAIPLCMIGEFDLPESVVDRKVCCIELDFVDDSLRVPNIMQFVLFVLTLVFSRVGPTNELDLPDGS